ncbi:DUF6002 family protein [Microbispora triticiradicis]|uniref:DUF6002 family protein n=1 Tax=Microbispora triticiradicis TaxID=2200763 RepID=UPI001AD6476B|nr:DUF6002 family protein [Microbispora triticiradicis]MBO4270889.1 hypothetical protein [Microbispora triticiradicis]
MTVTAAASVASASAPAAAPPALVRYYDELSRILAHAETRARSGAPDGGAFTPGWSLPPLTPELEAFFAPSLITAHELEPYRDTRLTLLNLMHNPRTRTTKTFASLMIVARAVAHIRRTGEAVMIITPSSANKATALRDAVQRAHETGLAGENELGIVCVVPSASRHKLWRSALVEDPRSRRRNPLAVLDSGEAGQVKTLARAVADEEAHAVFARHGVRLWHSLDLANYAVADAARALFERDRLPAADRVHAHSVSSAFGLLGHFYGQQWHTGREWPGTGARYFLVQHLGTPDMVSSLYHGTFGYRPEWTSHDGLLTQHADPHFPRVAYASDEDLDPTFYTRTPVTSPRMNEIIKTQGGGGIVVSLAECLDRYPSIRRLLEPAGVDLPADPRQVREWSLIMAVTGVLNAADRGLLDLRDVLVHGSGSYHTGDYRPPEADHLSSIGSLGDLRDIVHAAAAR